MNNFFRKHNFIRLGQDENGFILIETQAGTLRLNPNSSEIECRGTLNGEAFRSRVQSIKGIDEKARQTVKSYCLCKELYAEPLLCGIQTITKVAGRPVWRVWYEQPGEEAVTFNMENQGKRYTPKDIQGLPKGLTARLYEIMFG